MKTEKMFNLEEFAGGALAEQVNIEIGKVLKNISDPNTDSKKSRKVTVAITFKSNMARDAAAVTIDTKTTLAPIIPMETNIMIDRDLKSGQVLASEFRAEHRDQLSMEIPEEELKENENTTVIDMRKAGNK
jgi:hypothetical protein